MHRLILLALATAAAALAQLDTGSILGSVLDSRLAVQHLRVGQNKNLQSSALAAT